MDGKTWKKSIQSYDKRRDLIVPGNHEKTLQFCIDHFLLIAQESIEDHGFFTVALSGGSTPKAIYQGLTDPIHRNKIDWKHVHLYWSDERSVPPYDPESNYRMAMDAGFSHLPVPAQNIHRMQAEGDIEEGALAYEKLIKAQIDGRPFDLMMLGMGDDGHTASLFPRTHGLHTVERLVIANYVPQKNTWRMTMTYECINASSNITIYVLGKSKAPMVKKVLSDPYQPDEFPVQKVGTPEHKALWILDSDAASEVVLL